MTTIEPCAATCGLVRMLLADRARLTGTSVAVQQVTWGMDPDPPDAA